MKFFAVFAAIVAVACGSPNVWTINQLSEAIQSPHTSAAYLPYLEQALNEMMAAIFAGQQIETATVAIPSTDLGSMTLSQISQALQNPETDPALVPYLETALNQMMDNLIAGSAPVAVAAAASITVPAMDISFWTLSQLSEALQNPSTDAALVPYLENALNQIMDTLVAGEQMDFVVIATPAGVIPVEAEATLPIAPVNPTPVVVAPVIPAPATPATPSSPLVQIIINIKQQEEIASVIPAPVAVAQPALMPEPITIVEHAPIVPEAVSIVEQAPVVPEAVTIVEQAPESVIVVDNAPIAPESVSVVQPNPIDVIAVMPPTIVAAPSVVGPM